MPSYRVCFFNDLPDPTGHEHHVCQRTVEVLHVADEQQAIEYAIAEFERLEHICPWHLHARTIECEVLT